MTRIIRRKVRPRRMCSSAFVLVAGLTVSCKSRVQAADHLYVSSEESGVVTFVDLKTGTVIGATEAGKRPRGVQTSPDGARVYVALSGTPNRGPGGSKGGNDEPAGDRHLDGIGVLDTATRRLLGKLPAGSDPEQLAVSADGSTLYVSNEDASELSIVRVQTNQLVGHVQVGTEPEGVTLAPDGRTVWVTSEAEGRIDVVDVDSLQEVASVPVGARPRALVMAKDGLRAWVSLEADGSIGTINVPKRSLEKTLKLAGANVRPMGLALSPDGEVLYVTTGWGKTVVAVSTARGEESWSLEVGARPWGISVSPDGQTLYTANGPSDDVAVVDVPSRRVRTRIHVGGRPWGVALGR